MQLVTVNDGEIITSALTYGESDYSIGIYNSESGDIKINGGTISATNRFDKCYGIYLMRIIAPKLT